MRRILTNFSTRFLVAVVVLGDLAAVASFVPLERFSLIAAANKSSSAWLLLGLLVGNVVLLALVFFLITASAMLAGRFLARRRVRVITGSVEREELKERV